MLLAVALGACGPTIRPDFNSPEPAARNAAIVRAMADRDERAIPDLVRMLDSDDPATRLLAINALESLTGTRLGYDPAASPQARAPGVRAWADYVRGVRPEGPDAP